MMTDRKLVIPPDVSGELTATLMISVDEVFGGFDSYDGYRIGFKWWGSEYTHYFKIGPALADENSVTFHVLTKLTLFERYLKKADIHFKLMKGSQVIGTAKADYSGILSGKLHTDILPVKDKGLEIARIRVTFKLSMIEEDVQIPSNVQKLSMSKIVEDTNKIQAQIVTFGQADCESSSFVKKILPASDLRTKSQQAKVVDYIQGKEMTKEEEEEALLALHCTSPLPSMLHLSRSSVESLRKESIYESDPGSDLEKMVTKTTSSAMIERGIQFSKDSIVNAFTRTKNVLNISIDSYRLGISKLILSNGGLRKIFNIPSYNVNISGTYPTGTEFIFEYHPVSSLGKSWFRPFILSAKRFDQNIVQFNEYMISKIKCSPDPWKLVNELCEGSEIKVYWRHSNEKLPSLLGATKYPSDSPTENFSKNLCLPLYTKYKLHVGNLLMKVELGCGLIFGKALVDSESFDSEEKEPKGRTFFHSMSSTGSKKAQMPKIPSKNAVSYVYQPNKKKMANAKYVESFDSEEKDSQGRTFFRSMSTDSKNDKIPKILSKNSVAYLDRPNTKKMLHDQCELLDNQLAENLLTKQQPRKEELRSDLKKEKTSQINRLSYDDVGRLVHDYVQRTSSSSHASSGLNSLSNLKPCPTYHSQTEKCCPPKYKKKNRKKTKWDSSDPEVINVDSESSLQSSPERKWKKRGFISQSYTPTSLHVIKLIVNGHEITSNSPWSFFLEYKFPNVDDEWKVFWDPKIYRLDLDVQDSKTHNLRLAANVNLSEAFDSLHNRWIPIKVFAKLPGKKEILISQDRVHLDNISHLDTKELTQSQFLCIPLKLNIPKSISRDLYIPFEEITFKILYVKNPEENNAKTELERLENILEDEMFLRGMKKYEEDWRDEFKEPSISRDPFTGDPKSSRADSKKDFDWRKLQEKCYFPNVRGAGCDDFRPSSHVSFLSNAENRLLPDIDFVDLDKSFVDLDKSFIGNENPFETPAELRQKEYWTNQELDDVGSRFGRKCNGVSSEKSRIDQIKDPMSKKFDNLQNVEVIELSSDEEDKGNDGGLCEKINTCIPEETSSRLSASEKDFFEHFMKPLRVKMAELEADEEDRFLHPSFDRETQCSDQDPKNYYNFDSSVKNVIKPLSEGSDLKNQNQQIQETETQFSQKDSIIDKSHLNESDNESGKVASIPDSMSDEKKLLSGEATKAETLRLLKKYQTELIELSEDEIIKDKEVVVNEIDTSKKINMKVDEEVKHQNESRLPGKIRVNIIIESALNLLKAVCDKESTEENKVLPSSCVEITSEVNNKTVVLQSPWVRDAQAPLYDFSKDVELPSNMFYKKDKELEVRVLAEVKGEKYTLKAFVDLTCLCAGMRCIEGVYFLHLGTLAQGIVLLKITPLDNLEPLREAWENTFGMVAESVRESNAALEQYEERCIKDITEMESLLKKMDDLLECKEWKQPEFDTLKKILSYKNSTTTPTYIKKYTETLNDNWTSESYSKNKINRAAYEADEKTSDSDSNYCEKVIHINDNYIPLDMDFNSESVTNEPKDNLDEATCSIDKIIQALRQQHILD